MHQCIRSFSTYSPAKALPRSGAVPNFGRLPPRKPIRDVSKVIAIASAKGGVGKSTIAALAMVHQGRRIGILDADIFGPSIPRLLSLSGEPRLDQENRLVPLVNYGLKAMSMGFLVPPEGAIVWRGLMVMKALQQLLHEVEWGGLDVLVIDMPPGTGDTQLTITQQIDLHGVAIVSTPQMIAVNDAVRGMNMLKKVNVPILGLIENMASFTCPHCHCTTPIFLHGGVQQESEKNNIPILGSVPLDPRICEDADNGKPSMVQQGEEAVARAKVFKDIGVRLLEQLKI